MSVAVSLISAKEQSTGEYPSTTASYEGRQVYDVGQVTANKKVIHKNFDTPLSETVRSLCTLYWWPEGWNGYDALEPNHSSIEHAYSWINQLYTNLSATLWIRPHVIADADGDVVFEWWKDHKKLTVYVSPTTVEYVTVEGPDVASEMEDGTIETSQDSLVLWHWLIS
jgi:hypothetical protein